MKRTKTRQPREGKADAIIVSDLHLTDSVPISRTDDYLAAQTRKLQFLSTLSETHDNCPVLCAGDVFDHWKASPWLCQIAFRYLPRPFITIPGQHDLPMHSVENYDRSALSLIDHTADDVTVLLTSRQACSFSNICVSGVPYGEEYPQGIVREGRREILMLHQLTWKGARPMWDKSGGTDLGVLEEYGGTFDLIITGDNHQAFATRWGNSLMVNPGSMMRMSADQEEYKPRCYLYYADSNDIEIAYFPIDTGVHNREHIDRIQERDERIAAYIERMERDWEVGLSFKENLEAFFAENKVTEAVKEIIWQHLETETI